ncbi:MAG TPA: DUF5666 domain-containing protein [Solirubrobacteraceae bacterium]|jgi:hypothetical protein|nr:DUF5666 domain-containing protein [Solirubrobacteraceae bacterium]
MSALPYDDSHEHDWETSEQHPSATPARPRRRFFNRRTAALAAVLTCAGGFFAGVRVEKGQLTSTASAAPATAAAGARTGAAGAATGAAAGGAGGFAARFGGAGGGGAAGGGGPAGANASLGTLSSVNGNTLYLTDTSGNTVKVTLSGTTKLTKSVGVSKGSLHPGDSVVIQGVKNSGGTLVATSVSDSGVRTTGAPTGGGSSPSSTSASGG